MSLNFNHKAGGQIEESGYKCMRYHLLVEMHFGTEVLKIRQKWEDILKPKTNSFFRESSWCRIRGIEP